MKGKFKMWLDFTVIHAKYLVTISEEEVLKIDFYFKYKSSAQTH